MLVAYQKAKKEIKAKIEEILEKNLEIEENKMFIYIILSFDKFFLKNFLKNSLNDF